MKPTSLIALAGLALPLLASGATPADETRIRAIVDAAILPVMAEHKLPGMAVALTLDGKPHYFNYGVASLESRAPVSERTIFELGSISKTFTATLASHAQVQGKLSLDDHPSRFLPQLRGSPIDKATLLELGTYTAGGLPLQFPGSVTKAGVDQYFRHWKPVAPAGTQRLYSNPSIGLMGYAAARALGRDSAEALEHLVFPAFGLESTYVNVPAAAMGRYAWGHDGDKPVRVKPGPLDVEAYGVKSTAADLLRFVQANIDPSGLPAPMARAVLGTQVPYFRAGPMVQGLGWEQYPYPPELPQWLAGTDMNRDAVAVTRVPPTRTAGTTLFQKTGSTGGFGAYAVFIPQKRVGIVMLANRYYPNAERVKAAHAILSRLAP